MLEGQSINRSSLKYHIPARTLRDWMKRLNIKSVFTHSNGGKAVAAAAAPAEREDGSGSGKENQVQASSEAVTVTAEVNGQQIKQVGEGERDRV